MHLGFFGSELFSYACFDSTGGNQASSVNR